MKAYRGKREIISKEDPFTMSSNGPFKVMTRGIQSAIHTKGPHKGLPMCLGMYISQGKLSLEEVKSRGWIYA